ncbi:MAG TPA: hypothetical protein VL126_05845 [Bacteroidota bacterium]|nr:hypothetical protein [Bacteroidota bacterium]
MIEQYVVALAVAAVASIVATPLIIKIAHHVGALDMPGERKVHTKPIPRLGGLAVFVSFAVTALAVFLSRPDTFQPPWHNSLQGIVLGVMCLFVLALGVWDDIRELGPGKKFLVELLISTVVYLAGVRIAVLSPPAGGDSLFLGWLSYPVTVLWIVGVMNALNLIDGLDGLASGVAMVAAITVAAVSFAKFDDYGTAMLAVILAGSLLGFLRYNFNPAKIFLGDSGSLLLGFVLAVISILSQTKGSAAFAVLIPALSLGLPILDTMLAMARRILRPLMRAERTGETTLRRLRSMFLPDKDHIHHRLLALGLSQREAVILLYFVSSALGCSAFGLTMVDHVGGVLILAVAGMALVAGVHRLKYREFAIFRQGVLLPLYDRPFVHRAAFQILMDLGFTVAAFVLAFFLTKEGPAVASDWESFRLVLVCITSLQMAIFALSGIYKSIMRHAGVEDAVRIMKALSIALVIALGLHFALGFDLSGASTKTFLLDFYFLLTLLVMSRFSFAVLNRIAHYTREGATPVVIYGTGEQAVVAARVLLNSPELRMRPMGFLDDDPRLEGKTIHGYPVYGGHWKLERLIRVRGIKAVVIATEKIQPEALRQLRNLSRIHRFPVKSFTPSFQDLALEPEPSPAVAPRIAEQPADPPHAPRVRAVDIPSRNT